MSEYREHVARLLAATRYRLRPDGRLEPEERGWDGFGALLLVALAALDERRARLKRCQNRRCRWLFLDESDNQTRRWCDANACGNRIKVRAFRARQKRRARPRGR